MILNIDSEYNDQTERLSRFTLCADLESFVRGEPNLTTFVYLFIYFCFIYLV